MYFSQERMAGHTDRNKELFLNFGVGGIGHKGGCELDYASFRGLAGERKAAPANNPERRTVVLTSRAKIFLLLGLCFQRVNETRRFFLRLLAWSLA